MSPPTPSAAPSSEEVLERGQTIDRFVVLGLVGRGGMGAVYAAYDPELDRKVAIKLLRARGGTEDGKARLLREAQATAKLQHPNVVVVYDVGTFGDSVFIAMEFVEGRTMNGWLHAGQRSRREILDVYLAAGRGLAAAHGAGLVHRDFKPDNVMVTEDGQVRVMDFGLARQVGDESEATRASKASLPAVGTSPRPTAAERAVVAEALSDSYDPEETRNLRAGSAPPRDLTTSSGKYLSIKLTQTGAMLGTPAYMAPEQFSMRGTDARTDQFSFCVALYEALYGARPFAGDTFLALMTSVTTGAVGAAPAGAKVPGWLRKILLRGLATDPERRYPAMAELLRALETDPTVRTRRLSLGVVAVAALAVAAVGARRLTTTRGSLCRVGGERWAGIWEAGGAPSTRKDAIHRAFVATGVTYAEQSFAGATRYLDEYVRGWLGMYQDACDATHVRGEQSAEVLDLRMSCLRERVVEVRALTDELANANAKIVENAVAATSSIGRVDRCADVRGLRAVVAPPADAAARARVQTVGEQTARLLAARYSGKCEAGRKLRDETLAAARATGYGPVLARALTTAGFVDDTCGGTTEAIAENREAFTVALASGDDRTAGEAASFLAFGIADHDRNVGEAKQWIGIGRALVTRLRGNDEIEAILEQASGLVAQYAGDVAASLAALERMRIVNVRIHGADHPYVALAYVGAGTTYQAGKRYAEALDAFDQAERILVKAVGSSHPWVAMADSDAGETLNALGRHAEARVRFERAVAAWAKEHADPSVVAYGETGLGLARLGEGRDEAAIEPLEHAFATRTEAKAPPDLLGETTFGLARALWSRPKERPRSLALARQAREALASVKPPAVEALAAVDAWLAKPGGAPR
jgi:serine/threonine protein kinase/tetratricopeptide (TPR) repeat protein